MRTEKEIKEKIKEIEVKFFEDKEHWVTLGRLRVIRNALRWVLGDEWKSYRKARTHGARLNRMYDNMKKEVKS